MRSIVALALLLPGLALAQGLSRAPRAPPDVIVWTNSRNAGLAAAGNLGGIVVPRAVSITAVNVAVGTAGGGGAGNTVIRITDGTNNCDATLACSVSGSAGFFRTGVTANFTLSGTCTFAAGATVRASVQTAGCTTTQPTAINVDFLGNWK